MADARSSAEAHYEGTPVMPHPRNYREGLLNGSMTMNTALDYGTI